MRAFGPRRLDGRQAVKIKPNSLEGYRKAARKFCDFCLKEGYEPWSSEEVEEDVASVLDEGVVGTPITIIRLVILVSFSSIRF